MTLPFERTYALRNTREFLKSLLDKKATPRVPLKVRQEARWCLKHFPWDSDLEEAAKKCPKVFGVIEPAEDK